MAGWKLKDRYTAEFAEAFSGADDLTLQLLFERGIKSTEERDSYFNPDYNKHLHDPFLMKDMDKACDRIIAAIHADQRIFIFGDYDADGICGSVILAEFFEKIKFNNFEIYNPDRNTEGHGLGRKSLKEIIDKKPNLVITIDNGITSYEEVEELNKHKIDTIITDHHIVPEKIPPAYAVVDVKQANDEYPFKELCGTTVGFKLVQALISRGDWELISGWEKWLLDLVAIATIADMMPLTDENRALVHWGFEVLKKTKRLGLLEIFRTSKIDQKNITTEDISFYIAPRLNAASRMEHASLGVSLLRTNVKSEAAFLVGRLEQANVDRRKFVDEVLDIALAKFKGVEPPPIIFIGDKSWKPGTLGIVASRLVEEFRRPAFIWAKAEAENIKGSCRSDGSVNLVELMRLVDEDLFIDFGGHPMAGGFTLNGDVQDEFERQLLTHYGKAPKPEKEELLLDTELTLEDIDWNTYALIERFEPFGQGNPKPLFLFKNLEVKNVRSFGNGGAHLEFSFLKPDNKFVSAIGFWTKNHDDPVKIGDRIDLAAPQLLNHLLKLQKMQFL